jgi:hypothetical protein
MAKTAKAIRKNKRNPILIFPFVCGGIAKCYLKVEGKGMDHGNFQGWSFPSAYDRIRGF